MRKNIVVLVVVLIAAIGLGAWQVSAQGPDDDTTPPMMGQGMQHRGGMMGGGMMGQGRMHGRGMMGQGMMYGGMMGAAVLDEVAAALNLEPAALTEALQSGKTLTEIAAEQGVETQVLIDAILAARQAHLDEMVASGMMTQAQVDAMLAHMTEELPEHLDQMFSGTPHGHMEDCPFLADTDA